MKQRCVCCFEEHEEGVSQCPYCGFRDSEYEEDQYHLPLRTVLKGRYIIGKPLGHGGFGVTYMAWDSLLEKKVAIKEYLPSDFATRSIGKATVKVYDRESAARFQKGMESFLNESRRLAKFKTVEGIVSIFDCFNENNTAYIVMEYLEGKTLAELVKERGKLPYDQAIYIMIQVLHALDVVHQADIIHRDIAPDNVFVCDDGRIKLIDFGAARFVTTSRSRSLSMIVKLGYAPVEQYTTHGNQGTWTDVYACGATLYYAITGVVPPHSYDRIEETKSDKLVNPSKLVKKLPKNVETAILNAMNILPENRTQTVKSFAEELESSIDVKRVKEKIEHEDTGRIPKWLKMNAVVAAVIAVTVVVLIFVGAHTIAQNDRMIIPDGMTRIPSVISSDVDTAENTLDDSELKMVIGGRIFDDYYDVSEVVIQNPYAGGVAYENSLVSVILSGNTDSIIVPNVKYFTQKLANSVLEKLGLFVKIEEEYSDVVAEGCVIEQSLKAGSTAKAGELIVITISKGSKDSSIFDADSDIEVPNLVGMDIEDAYELLVQNKLMISVGETQYSDTYAKDVVLVQDIKAKTGVSEGTVITVTISLGKQKAVVPDVMYMQEEDAVNKIEGNTLKYEISYKETGTVAVGCVMEQSPKAGTSVEANSVVKIVVSKGYTVFVPDVTGKKESDAKTTIQKSGLACKVVYEPSDTVPQGCVIRQSVKSGEKVQQGSIIEIVVSSGSNRISVTGVKLNKSSATLDYGEKLTLFATVSPKNATNTVVTWSSSNSSVASVDSNGIVTAKGIGTAVITVKTSDGGFTSVCNVEVVKAVTSISASGYKSQYYQGESFSVDGVVVTVQYNDGSTENVTSSCTFSNFSSANLGSCKVNVSYSYRGRTANTSFYATIIKDCVSLGVEIVELSVDGDACPKTYKLNLSYASGKKMGALTWKSSDSSIASVDQNGNVTAKKGNNICEVGAITSDGLYATCWVRIWSECEWKVVYQESLDENGTDIVSQLPPGTMMLGTASHVFDTKTQYSGQKYTKVIVGEPDTNPFKEIGDSYTYEGETWTVYDRVQAFGDNMYIIRKLGDYCEWTDTVLSESNGYYNVRIRKLEKVAYGGSSSFPYSWSKSLFQ